MGKAINFLFNPKVALTIFVIFLVVYLVVLEEEGAFTKKFLHFGPSDEYTFLTMKLNNWTKVSIVYLIAFFSSILSNYYGTVMFDFIHSTIWNPAYTEKIQLTKSWTTVIMILEPLLYFILTVLNFFVTLTMQLQFILPRFIGQAIVDIPYALYKISQNTFIK